jgi:hypothetical protein
MATRGYEHVTLDQARQMGKQPAKPSKYRNVKTTVDGLQFDSKKEAARYRELVALIQAGHVIDLQRQTPFRIAVHDVEICRYYADFSYKELVTPPKTGQLAQYTFVVEDVKSPATKRNAVYRLKRKLFEAQYGITIRET